MRMSVVIVNMVAKPKTQVYSLAHVCIDIDLSIFLFFLVKGFLFDVLNSNKHDVLNSNL